MPATPAWPPRSAPRLFISEPLAAGVELSLEGQQAHYLSRVMRAAPGDSIILCDNQTGEWAATISAVARRSVDVTIDTMLRPRQAVPDLWLCPALLKKDRFDQLVEKATELGVDKIRPVLMRRCVADSLNLERARKVSTEAAEQCARTALPEFSAPVKLAALLDNWPDNRPLFFADEMGGTPAFDAFRAARAPAALLLGPEGGFDNSERAQLRACPFVQPVSLGPRILRAETAAIAATALWMAAAGDWAA